MADTGERDRAETGAAIEDIYGSIRRRILTEEFYPGRKLTENALAREYGCSRTPIRESLKRLESEGLIEVRPQSGTYVRRSTSKDYVELLEVRAYLEGLAFRLAVERAPDEGLEALAGLLAEMDAVTASTSIDMARYAELHYRFHYDLVRLAGNELLVSMFERLNLRSSHMFLRSMSSEGAARTQEEHYRILALLRARDRKGERFVVDHLWRKKESL
ncbi:MAG: GntR family transcriptional regulator [Spirochaetaceae bacterium]|nr:GntR family transcriptional regulator [Spirochaetaceae bacterium]